MAKSRPGSGCPVAVVGVDVSTLDIPGLWEDPVGRRLQGGLARPERFRSGEKDIIPGFGTKGWTVAPAERSREDKQTSPAAQRKGGKRGRAGVGVGWGFSLRLSCSHLLSPSPALSPNRPGHILGPRYRISRLTNEGLTIMVMHKRLRQEDCLEFDNKSELYNCDPV